MNALKIQLKQHRLATGLFMLYTLGWASLIFWPASPGGSNTDACAQGMKMVYPVLAAYIGTFVYGFSLLLFAVFADGSRGFFFGLLVLAIAMPVILTLFS
jgi:hypothetical protein